MSRSASEWAGILLTVPEKIRGNIARTVLYDHFGKQTIAETTPDERALWNKYGGFDDTVYNDDELIVALIAIGYEPERAVYRIKGERADTPKDSQVWTRNRQRKGMRYKTMHEKYVQPYEVSGEIGFDPDKYEMGLDC